MQDPDSNLFKQTVTTSNDKQFTFDQVFSENQSNSEIFSQVVDTIVSHFLKGYNTTIFAYGMTSAGKTFTMFGNKDDPGIILLSI